jgi:patatin-like phospholipase/acyl hydrolase
LVINAYNASRDGPHLFKTYHHPDHYRHYRMRAADIALATAAAPLFFRSKELPLGDHCEDQTFVDGGIWANCPVLVGITEARRYFNAQLDTIDVLSIGTTYKPVRIKDIQKTGGIAQWRRALISLLFSAQQASAVGTANKLLKRPVCRITRKVSMEMPLDTTAPEDLNQLVEWGRCDAAKGLSELKRCFFCTKVPLFTPESAKFAKL